MYSKTVMEHFTKPHNMGKIENADAVGKIGNLVCGDVMKLYLKIAKNKTGKCVIKNIKFETFGCVAAIATSSMITDLAKGKTLEEALKITRNDVSAALESLPPIKEHCSNLAADALSEAIYNYLIKQKLPVPEELRQKHGQAMSSNERHAHAHGHHE